MNNKIPLTKSYLDKLTFDIVGACIEVHRELGAGLLESVYHKCLVRELQLRKLNFSNELVIPLNYKGLELDADLRCDFFIENCIVLEIKAVNAIAPVFEAQLMTYMKLLKAPKGILVNFHTDNIFYKGQKTYVNEFFAKLPDK